VLEQSHPSFYWPPKPGEQHAYARIRWRITGPHLDHPAIDAVNRISAPWEAGWDEGATDYLEGDFGTVAIHNPTHEDAIRRRPRRSWFCWGSQRTEARGHNCRSAGGSMGQSVRVDRIEHPDLQPGDERTALVQRLGYYRAIAIASLIDLRWDEASTRLLPATDLTIAGIVKHLAWAEDRWFQGRLLGTEMPTPWDQPGADDPDRSMRLAPGDTIDGIVELYTRACERSLAALGQCDSLSAVAAVPSFGKGPVNARWILVHMIDETARHAGHLDLLRDCLEHRA
jgi:hypothetical protein